ncbi:hypothetical protein GF352_04140 [archaeon]|nr:hypothetical protein [archaeon]
MITPSLGFGVLSHLLLDLLNKQGVKLLYPRKTRYTLLDAPLVIRKHDPLVSLILFLGVLLC